MHYISTYMVADGSIRSACGAGGGIASTEGEGAEYCQYRKPERWNKVLWASLRESLGGYILTKTGRNYMLREGYSQSRREFWWWIY